MPDKIKISIRVEAELLNRLHKYIADRHTHLYGKQSEVAAKALNQFLQEHGY